MPLIGALFTCSFVLCFGGDVGARFGAEGAFRGGRLLKTNGAANTEARRRTGILSSSDDDLRYGGDFDETEDRLDKVQESTFL